MVRNDLTNKTQVRLHLREALFLIGQGKEIMDRNGIETGGLKYVLDWLEKVYKDTKNLKSF